MHSNVEKTQDHRRPGKRRPRRVDLDTRPDLLRQVELMRDETERDLLAGFNDYADQIFDSDNFLTERSFGKVYSGMNDVLHPPSGRVAEWLDGVNAPYGYNADTSHSSSSQRVRAGVLTSRGYDENVRRDMMSRDINCDYSTKFVFDIEDVIAKSHARRKKVAEADIEEEEGDLVPEFKDLSIDKKPRRQRAGSAGIRDASEYKQSRGVRKR